MNFVRARPALGTLVEIAVGGLDGVAAASAVDAAFAEIATVHRCMSFHTPDSDLARVHAQRVGAVVAVDTRTVDVLRCALDVAGQSSGAFDPTVAAQLVACGALPRPAAAFAPDPQSSWRDVELLGDVHLRLRAPLWLDLGGIAKGYAVDRAVQVLIGAGASQVRVNAGGDLRVVGPCETIVHLRGASERGIAGAVALTNAALASSAGAPTRRRVDGLCCGTHLHGRTKQPVGKFSGVSVIAADCMIADALTKVVLAASPAVTRRVLAHYGAHVARHSARHGWRRLGVAA